jgi:hypothetical protein
MTARTIRLIGPGQKAYAKRLIDGAGKDDVCIVRPATRTDDQNSKLWPMLNDLRQQVEGMDRFTADDIKLRFLNALGAEMRFLPELEGAGMFPVGLRSSTLTKEQFSGLLELLYAYGAKHGVQWSDPQEQGA